MPWLPVAFGFDCIPCCARVGRKGPRTGGGHLADGADRTSGWRLTASWQSSRHACRLGCHNADGNSGRRQHAVWFRWCVLAPDGRRHRLDGLGGSVGWQSTSRSRADGAFGTGPLLAGTAGLLLICLLRAPLRLGGASADFPFCAVAATVSRSRNRRRGCANAERRQLEYGRDLRCDRLHRQAGRWPARVDGAGRRGIRRGPRARSCGRQRTAGAVVGLRGHLDRPETSGARMAPLPCAGAASISSKAATLPPGYARPWTRAIGDATSVDQPTTREPAPREAAPRLETLEADD
jgi:hypothetical protein